ncbi:MAG: histidine phosphatase family protein [Flavobacteriales bacterium]|nr:hypothetical protein [Flavobacteriales bacterium]MCC6578777.1 histidine phosphatase family protein [Flavobacteriales bacterium]NUQ13758.1 histidine phosphatase family protein [Flavobacteriales bacterium]
MRTLLLTRHAKSSWDHPEQRDFDRPLNARGERDAPAMAQRFARRGMPAPLLVSSTARRAWRTAQVFAATLGIPEADIVPVPNAYHADEDTLLDIVQALPDAAPNVMLFGHNPGISTFAHALCRATGEMATCHTVCLELDVERWADVGRACGRLLWEDFPKMG